MASGQYRSVGRRGGRGPQGTCSLRDNSAAGLSFDYRDWTANAPLPRANDGLNPEQRGHGTAVAGIIAARGDNGVGGSGVAPLAQIAGYNALIREGSISDALKRNLEPIGALGPIDVFHNSWGSPDSGRLEKAETGFTDAIERGLVSGRRGLGALYVFSAGNGGCLGYPRTDCRDNVDLSNYDGYLNHRGVIVACAFDHKGKRPRWAERGSNLLVCGPSGPALVLEASDRSAITTTALDNGYRDDFANSSASAPMVSGVIALMLSANVNLSARDVRLILARSARKNDPLDPDWEPGAGGGLPFSASYGFGAVDADKAVELARNWKTVGTESELLSCAATRTNNGSNGAPVAIPDAPAEGIAEVIRIDSSCAISRIEHVELRLGIDHQYTGDLDIDLVSPSGTRSLLARARDCGAPASGRTEDCGQYNEAWPITSVRHLDEPALGDWHLRISDRVAGKIGSLRTWTLRIRGR
jgi:subtilisin-like proprotein convertase family protein